MGEVDEALREVGRHDPAGAACLPADVAAMKGFEISYIYKSVSSVSLFSYSL